MAVEQFRGRCIAECPQPDVKRIGGVLRYGLDRGGIGVARAGWNQWFRSIARDRDWEWIHFLRVGEDRLGHGWIEDDRRERAERLHWQWVEPFCVWLGGSERWTCAI